MHTFPDPAPGQESTGVVAAPTPELTRRTVIARLAALAGLAPAAALVVAGGAGLMRVDDAAAGITWCRTDPVINVNGKVFHVYVLSTQPMFSQRSGPTEIIVKHPSGVNVTGSLLPNDNGFGLGYNLNLQAIAGLQKTASSFQIKVAVRVGSYDGSLPVRMEANRDSNGALLAAKNGTPNTWFECAAFWL